MDGIEKVVKALRGCPGKAFCDGKAGDDDCPFWDYDKCIEVMCSRAADLLEDYKPRAYSESEIRKIACRVTDHPTVWLQIHDSVAEPARIEVVHLKPYCHVYLRDREKPLEFSWAGYNVVWRCWTAPPIEWSELNGEQH